MKTTNKIILFYKYIDIVNPIAICDWQRELCQKLDLKGRILIAPEGINATVGGKPEQVDSYITAMRTHELFHDIDFKESFANGACFPKLKVKVRKEIVNLGIDTQKVRACDGGKHITPQQAHELITNKTNDLVILDARNAFEARIGKFVDAIVPNIEYFRELPEYLDNNEDLFRNKKVLMYCTGGIRCERASAYLKSKNIAKEVYQINGGIHRYIEAYPDGYFRGKNYVFDGRVSVRVNDNILSQCEWCKKACDDYINCVNVKCNKHFILCIDCQQYMQNSCSQACFMLLYNNQVQQRSIPAKTAHAIRN